ncbi:diol dehydratase small subunit [Limosilactobacillus panis]|jgi:propanediol dehydratase small subunit|uniref:Propanediol dehydratase small subunit n=1 Tax=Limosilactobacillus panis TaxID=47493 RepID=V5RSC9_9LACO|nr:diol dehydratase small subunit [Limosilactobacillus panis]AHB39738.1 propanediol dehydratase small subunit [Limosilactobacillus panis]QZN93113.1 diol dehydratase small subunit [Limosilactobacillus panis]
MSEIDDLVKKITQQLGEQSTSAASSKTGTTSVPDNMGRNDYPLYGKHRNLVKTPTGKNLDDINLNSIKNDQIKGDEMRITPEALKMQGEIAASAGRPAIQKNFQRAAELTKVPDARLLQMYNALRPYRSSKQDLLDIADELRNKYNAPICAAWFEEAAKYYESRKKLKGDN